MPETETEATQLRTLIVDDEPLAVERVQVICAEIPAVRVVGTASDGAAALRLAEKLEPDLVLLDIKQINDEKHIPLTHVSNKYTLEFARYLASRGQTMWIRYVVVPTWSDDDESAEGLGQFIAELGECVEKVELLPYHELGKHKWDVLGDTYDLVGIKPPSKETMDRVQGILGKYHPNVKY